MHWVYRLRTFKCTILDTIRIEVFVSKYLINVTINNTKENAKAILDMVLFEYLLTFF